MLNNVSGTTDNLGISLFGSLLGSTRPRIESLITDNNLRLNQKAFYIPQNVSATGNNKFVMPISFGLNKCILSVEGELFYPTIDYTINGNEVTWKNTSRSITTSDLVIAFGPANEYTAQAFEIKIFNMLSLAEFDDTLGSKTLYLDPNINLNSENMPFNTKSIFLVINGKNFIPETEFNYNDTISTKPILIDSSVEALVDRTKKVMVYYFNQVQTNPYKLGEKLIRFTLDSNQDHQSTFGISAIPNPKQKLASCLFYERNKYAYNLDYKLNFPECNIISGSKLKDDIVENKKIDLSFLRDQDTSAALLLFNQEITVNTGVNGNTTSSGALYSTNLLRPNLIPITTTKEFIFFNGLLGTGTYYDNGIYSSIPDKPFIDPDYERTSDKIRWFSQRDISNPIVPSDGEKYMFVGFLDTITQLNSRKQYHVRTISDTDTPNFWSISTPNIRGNKAIIWINGIAYFKEFGCFQIDEPNNEINEFRDYDGNLMDLPISVSPSDNHEYITWFFTNDSLASIFYFDNFIASSEIIQNQEILFQFEISNLQTSMLFVEGELYPLSSYRAHPTDNHKIILNPSSDPIPQDAHVMLVHL